MNQPIFDAMYGKKGSCEGREFTVERCSWRVAVILRRHARSAGLGEHGMAQKALVRRAAGVRGAMRTHPNTPTCGERLQELYHQYRDALSSDQDARRVEILAEYRSICAAWNLDYILQVKENQRQWEAAK